MIQLITRVKRGMTNERGSFLLDLDDGYDDLKMAIVANETLDTKRDPLAKMIASFVANKTKALYLCTSDAIGAKHKAFADFTEMLNAELRKGDNTNESFGFKTSLLSTKLIGGQSLGEGEMMRFTATLICGSRQEPLRIEVFQ